LLKQDPQPTPSTQRYSKGNKEIMLRKTLKKRVLFAALMASMLFGIAFSPAFTSQPTAARPCFSLSKDYYSDATYSVQVGQQYWPCVGQPSQWGVVTQYMETSTEECGGACGNYP
jgi:hypothetical protein